jgi:hypothetical protein
LPQNLKSVENETIVREQQHVFHLS